MHKPNHILSSKEFDQAASALAKVGRFLADRGWSPATSSNYSQRLNSEHIAITRSGINKFEMNPSDVIAIDYNGSVLEPLDKKSSAETLIHTSIYKMRGEANAVLHTHSPQNTRLSLLYLNQNILTIAGYEMQKGLSGVTTHESELRIPILQNSQDMISFSSQVETLLAKEKNIHGFLIAGHGLYTWGRDLQETQRHVETFEFLFECKALELMGV